MQEKEKCEVNLFPGGESRVESAEPHELVVGPGLGHPTLTHNRDLVRVSCMEKSARK